MNQQERLELLACGIYNEFEKIVAEGLGEEASLAKLKVVLEDAVENVGIRIKEIFTNGVGARKNNLFALVKYVWDFIKFTKWVKNDFTKLIELAMDLAVDPQFYPNQNHSDLESAIQMILEDEMLLKFL